MKLGIGAASERSQAVGPTLSMRANFDIKWFLIAVVHHRVCLEARQPAEGMAGFYFRLENEDGTPADPPMLQTAVPNWSAGDVGTGRSASLIFGTRRWRCARFPCSSKR